MFRKEFLRDSTSWKTPATEGEAEEERGAKEGRDREVPGLGKAGGSPGNPDARRTAGAARGMVFRAGTTGIRGPGREQEARLLKLGGDGGELGDSGADDVADGIVKEDPVTWEALYNTLRGEDSGDRDRGAHEQAREVV